MAAKKKKRDNLLNSYHLLSFDSLDSTNEEAKRLAKNGGSHGAVIWAKKQTAGKGRMGREWVSDEGNLFVSFLLKPDKPANELPQLSFMAVLAAIDAMKPLMPPGKKLQCKWPNDALLDGKKVGGILLESFKDDSGHAWVVVGIGVNIDSFPPRAAFPATCLKEAGVDLVSAKIVLSRLIHHFVQGYNVWDSQGFAPIRAYWTRMAWGLKTRVTARLPDGEITGISEGIDRDGSLILTLKDGKKQHIHAADIFPAEKGKASAARD